MLTQVSVASPSVKFMAAAAPKDCVILLQVGGKEQFRRSGSSPVEQPSHKIGLCSAF